MTMIEQVDVNRYRLRSPSAWLIRILGLPFVAFGLYVGILPLPLNLGNWAWGRLTAVDVLQCVPGMLVGMVIGLPILAVGWAMSFLRHRIEIDLGTRELIETKDLLVWRMVKSHSLDDVGHVGVRMSRSRDKDRTRYYANAVIVADSGEIHVASRPARQEGEIRRLASQLAELLDVPLRDLRSEV